MHRRFLIATIVHGGFSTDDLLFVDSLFDGSRSLLTDRRLLQQRGSTPVGDSSDKRGVKLCLRLVKVTECVGINFKSFAEVYCIFALVFSGEIWGINESLILDNFLFHVSSIPWLDSFLFGVVDFNVIPIQFSGFLGSVRMEF